MGRVEGKVVLVTGAASGIGRSASIKLAREGARVIATDIHEAGVRATVEMISGEGGRAECHCLDVTREEHWKTVIDNLVTRADRLDVLVNNAGAAFMSPVVETSLETWREVLSVNLDGAFLGTRFGIEAMTDTRGGSIVNVCAAYALVGGPGAGAYGAANGGLRMLTKAASLECAEAQNKVRVNAVVSGFVDTPMLDDFVRSTPDAKVARRAIKRLHPMRRLAQPEEIASAIVYLASDESNFVTGTEIVVDGGMTAR